MSVQHAFVAHLIPDFEFALDDLALRTTDEQLFWMGPETRVVTVEDIAYAGLDEGLARAREDALAAQRAMLKELWSAKFGKVPRTVSTKLAKADARTLMRW